MTLWCCLFDFDRTEILMKVTDGVQPTIPGQQYWVTYLQELNRKLVKLHKKDQNVQIM